MKFIEYNPINEKGACILRTFTKLFDKDYRKIKEELIILASFLNCKYYNEIQVFEKYLSNNNYLKIDGNNVLVSNLNLGSGKYAIFAFKNDYYHMFPIIDNTIYDKDNSCLDLYVISIYKLNK
jgi:hypothetical protein